MDVILGFTAICSMRFKHAFSCPRPVAYSPNLQPIVPTPEHGSLPSGHSGEAYAVAQIIPALMRDAILLETKPDKVTLEANADEVGKQLRSQALRIAENRVVAGVHFPVDSVAGRILGQCVGTYLVALCGNDYGGKGRKFLSDELDTDLKSNPNFVVTDEQTTADLGDKLGCISKSKGTVSTRNEILGVLWDRAVKEWV
jgi:hypothetical protein